MVAHLKLLIAKLRHEQFGASSERGRKLLDQLELQLEELEAGAAEDEAALDPDPAGTAWPAADPPQAGAWAACPRTCRASGWCPRPDRLPVLPGQAVQAGRGRDRDAGAGAAALEGRPDRAREVRVPGVRDHHPAPGAVPPHRPRPRRARAAGHHPGRQVRPAPAAEPAERGVQPRGHRARHLDPGRLGGRLHRHAVAAGGADPRPRAGGGAAARRRHHRARAGPRQDDHRAIVGLRARRPAVRRTGAACGAVPLLARPPGRAPAAAPGRLCRDPASGCLCRVRRPLPSRAQAGPVTEAGCWAHGRRKLFDLAQLARAPLAAEAVRRIDAIFDAERTINGLPASSAWRCDRTRWRRSWRIWRPGCALPGPGCPGMPTSAGPWTTC